MAKQLIPEELDALIKEYLTDGVLTEKERNVILKKAEGMGLDHDEIDLYLDAQVQKIDQATDAAVRKQKGKQCPYCGGSVPQLTDKCPHCGEYITPAANQELQEILDNLETALIDLKSGKDIYASKAIVERYARKAKLYYANNPKILKLLSEIEKETIAAEKVAKSQIRNQTLLKFVTSKKVVAAIVIVIIALLFIKPWQESAESINTKVTELIKQERLDEAKLKLMNTDGVGTWDDFWSAGEEYVKQYDSIYLLLIKAYVENNNISKAEEVALSFRSKIGNDFTWKNSTCYKYLKVLFKQKGRDFSSLKSHRDSDDDSGKMFEAVE